MTIQTAILIVYLALAGLIATFISPYIGMWMLVGYLGLLIISSFVSGSARKKK